MGRRAMLRTAGAAVITGFAVGGTPLAASAAAQSTDGMSAAERNDAPLGARLQGVQHFGLTVQNMERAYEFYTAVLGGTEVFRHGDFQGDGVQNTLLADQEIEANARELSDRDVAALMQLVTLSEDFLATDGDVVRHLYVEDGDLKAQDKRAEKIEAWKAEAAKSLDALEPKLEGEGAKATLAEFAARYETFEAASATALKLSREETVDADAERDASRATYLEEVLPADRLAEVLPEVVLDEGGEHELPVLRLVHAVLRPGVATRLR